MELMSCWRDKGDMTSDLAGTVAEQIYWNMYIFLT
jgi:hypothetical protein